MATLRLCSIMIFVSLSFGIRAQAADSTKMKKKVSETAAAVGEYANDTKDDFKKEMNEDLAEIQTEMERLKKRAETATGAAQDSLKRQIANLESKRVEFKKKLDESAKKTGETSGEAWTQVKSGMKKAMAELKEGFAKAKATMTDDPPTEKK